MIDVDFPEILTPVFDNLSQAIYDAIVMYGGRGGAKSEALTALGVMESYIDDGVILCCREIQKSISDSIYGSLVSFIDDKKLSNDFKILNNEITNLRTGAKFIFAGLKHNITNIKSIHKLRVVLVDEAENVSQESWDYLRPTPRYNDTRIYVVFNPRFEADPTYQEFVKQADDTTLVIKIGWQDNPWFPPSLDRERKRALKGDAGRYAWIWEGNFLQISEASIYAKKIVSKSFEIDKSFGDPLIGIDWGFSNDPTAIVECYIKDNTLYIYNAASKVGLELDDTAEWLIAHVPNVKRYASRADNARPETISKVKRDGVPLMKACKKWKGCVEDGIAHIQSYDAIVIHPQADSCRAELTAYSFKKDKFDEITTIPLDQDNHIADACIEHGQLIATKRGFVPVQEVTSNDYVLTRLGYRKVVKQWKTYDNAEILCLKTKCGLELRATANHKVFTTNKGFVRVDALRYNDEVIINKDYLSWQSQKLQNTTAKLGEDTHSLNAEVIESILSYHKQTAVPFTCIDRFGKIISEQSPMAITFTTRTEIAKTTICQTLNCYQPKNTLVGIQKSDCKTIAKGRNSTNTLSELDLLQRFGTPQKRVEPSIEKSVQWRTKTLSQSQNHANNVVKSFCLKKLVMPIRFAQTLANLHGVETAELMMSNANVLNVASNSQQINTQRSKLVVSRVQCVTHTKTENKVYDIEVDGVHEFFASGILVHNCRYALEPYIGGKFSYDNV